MAEENEEEWIPIRLREEEEMDFFTELALHEAERWIQAVTRKKFEYAEDFRKSLGNGILLCELLNSLKPGSVKRINKLPGAISGLDNINVFLTACEKSFGLNSTQLFDPSDLEDLTNRAISDESEFFLKQEVDRRARNVAVTVFWLGKTVAGKYKGPALDVSAFGALVHSHGNKNIISEDSFKNGSPLTKDSHKHIRDSSYDSLGSYERESESSFDELDSGTMPVRSDMREMRRYGSASSLSMPRDLRLSTASGESMYSDDKHDSMYVSSPDLSQGSHAHTRSSSTDSMEGNYYGNHSRQSSGSTDNYATRRTSSSTRKTSTSAPDPLQFVKLKGAADLAAQAKKQMEVAKEVNMMRGKVDTPNTASIEEPDWQSNFNNWKSRRKSAHARIDSDTLDEEAEKRPQKTFSQIMAEKEKRRSVGPLNFYPTEEEDIKMNKKDKRRSLGPMNFYPLDDDDSGIGVKTGEPHISKSNSQKHESKPKDKKSKADIAPWAQDSSGEDNSQSDSETNNSHQSGDTDSVFSDKSTPSKVLSDDDSWVKSKQSTQTVSSKLTPPVRTQRSLGDSMKLWENSTESQRKDDKKVRDLPTNSAKIRNITQAFEQKDKEANAMPVVTKRSEYSRSSLSKSLDLTDSYSKPYSPLEKKPSSPLSPTAPKALIPRDQRFSQNNSPGGSPASNNADKPSVSGNVRYFKTLSPSHVLKPNVLTPEGPSMVARNSPATPEGPSMVTRTSPATHEGSSMVTRTSPVTPPKPSSAKIAAAKAKFESSNNNRAEPNVAGAQNGTTENQNVNGDKPEPDHEVVSVTTNNVSDKSEINKMHNQIERPKHSELKEGFSNVNESNGDNDSVEPVGKEGTNICDDLYDIPEDKQTYDHNINAEHNIGCEDTDKLSTEIGRDSYPEGERFINSKEADSNNVNGIEDFAEQIVDSVIENVKNQEINTPKQDIPKLDFSFIDNDEKDTEISSSLPVNELLKALDENRLPHEHRTEMIIPPVITTTTSSLSPPTSPVFVRSSRPITTENTGSGRSLRSATKSGSPRQQTSASVIESSIISHLPSNTESLCQQSLVTLQLPVNTGSPVQPSNPLTELPSDFNINQESPRPPALPTSSIPDIIVSNVADESLEENLVYDWYNTKWGFPYQRPDQSDYNITPDCPELFTEKTIKINQKPNDGRGFGFFLVGGCEKRLPVTVQRVSLGSAADVCEVEANDELISVNGRDVTTLTLAQVQGIVDHSVKRGQIELRVKRYIQEDGYDSMEESAFTDKASINNQTGHPNEANILKPALQMSARTEERPRLMDQLIGEQQREANNNERNKRAPSPVTAESFTADVTIRTQSAPTQQTTPVKQTASRAQDMSAPQDVIMTEERSTISIKKSPKQDEPPVQMRHTRAPVIQDSPPPPTPPKTELPPLAKNTESPGVTTNDDSSGFGPPAALLRWQRPRAKSEYQNPFPTLSAENQPSDRTKRFSATLPYKSDNTFSLDKDYSKDDSMLEKVSRDFVESVSVSRPVESKPDAYQFNDASRIEDWQQKQDQQRMPEPHSSTPPIELTVHREEHLTAQSAAPARKQAQVDAPNLKEIILPNNSEPPPLSPQEKFERDQQRIRRQYEEEKRRAREAEKQKQEQEQQALNSDKFLRDMESQIQQTKQEGANRNFFDNEPIRDTVTQPSYSSEPMTIRLPANSQGRQLVIDPRNQEDTSESKLPEYSFRVDLSKTESAPPLRTFNQPEIDPAEILAIEREKIREEEKQKFEEEQQRWKEEKERELREQQESIEREREHLQREQERVEREKALLDQKIRQEESFSSRYQPVNSHSRSSAGSSGSSLSQSPRSPPPALDPKYRETQSRKAPPPTAPKPERGSNKARLTREDLLAMNRKATPLARPDTTLETTTDSQGNSLSPSTREAPSKGELHSLNAVPKPKLHGSAAWIKDKDVENHTQNEKPFVIGKRSDLIHQRDYSNPSDHWLVREAEKRRLAEKSDYANVESVTARAGPTKPSQSSLVSRFRGDIEPPPRSNRYSYPSSYNSDSRLSPTSRPLSATGSTLHQYNRSQEPSVTQFSAKTSPSTFASNPSLSQTLPQNFSFNANVRNQDSLQTKPARSLTDDSGPVIAVSGKQKCSHCGEELGFGAAMVIESLGLYYHVQCFRCCVCRMPLGNGSEGTDVRVRVNKLHCRNCYSNDEAGLKFSKV